MRRVGGKEREIGSRAREPPNLMCNILRDLPQSIRFHQTKQLVQIDAVDDDRWVAAVTRSLLPKRDYGAIVLDGRLRPDAADDAECLHLAAIGPPPVPAARSHRL